jgi:hypothetical protein
LACSAAAAAAIVVANAPTSATDLNVMSPIDLPFSMTSSAGVRGVVAHPSALTPKSGPSCETPFANAVKGWVLADPSSAMQSPRDENQICLKRRTNNNVVYVPPDNDFVNCFGIAGPRR